MKYERWKDIPSYDGMYQASNKGRVRSKKTGKWKIMKGCVQKRVRNHQKLLYIRIGLVDSNGKTKIFKKGRLVLLAWRGEPKEGFEMSHINGVCTDDTLVNLKWESRKKNLSRRVFKPVTKVLIKVSTPKQPKIDPKHKQEFLLNLIRGLDEDEENA